MERESIERAIDGCYDAIVDPERWPDAMHALARSLDAVCGMFYPEKPDETLLDLPASHNYRDFLDEFVRGGWWPDRPPCREGLAPRPGGSESDPGARCRHRSRATNNGGLPRPLQQV